VDTEQPALAGYPVCEEAGQNKSGCAGKWIYIDIRLNDFIRSERFCDQDRVSTASLRINGKKGRNQWIACPVHEPRRRSVMLGQPERIPVIEWLG